MYSYTQPKRHTDSGNLPCDSVLLGIKLLTDYPIAEQGDRNGLNRQNSNNNATTLPTGEMTPDGPDSTWILADGALHSTP